MATEQAEAPHTTKNDPPTIVPTQTYESVNQQIGGIVLHGGVSFGWVASLLLAFGLLMIFMLAVTWLLIRGIGTWGVNIPVAWGFAIVNFVWWIGIGHAGTLISAFLLLMRQDWRTSINRFAEAMTLFAVSCAGLFPLLHLGRPWLFYWLLPYPNTMSLWPQWRSPLVWDVFAVSTYLIVSLIFWYAGLIPDAATLRDRARSRPGQLIFGVLALGWRGSARHWQRYQRAYLLLAALATPLVVSVHSVVSLDFTVAIVPGWHSTIFPPYFVIGAVFSGFAMVLTLAIPLRAIYRLQNLITMRHIEIMAKLLLATGLGVSYGYLAEIFNSWYSGDQYEWATTINRAFGPDWPVFWLVMFCNVLTPHALWFRRVRTTVPLLFLVALITNTGMWIERYMIVVTSLSREFVTAAWHGFHGTIWDWLTLLGSFGLFFVLFILFVRLLPILPISEVRELAWKVEGDRAQQDLAGKGAGDD